MANVAEKRSKKDVSSAEKGIPARLLYCKDLKEVLLMEVGREFVDILVTFMSLPLASIIHLFQQNQNSLELGGTDKLLSSLEKLRDSSSPIPWPITKLEHSSSSSMSLLRQKDTINRVYRCATLTCNLESIAMARNSYCPNCKAAMTTPVTLLSGKDSLYCCGNCGNSSIVSKHRGAACPKCGISMNKTLTVVNNPDLFVGAAPAEYLPNHTHRFLVADGPVIMPASAIDGIMLLEKEERSGEIGHLEINITTKQVIEFLETCFYEEFFLNHVFPFPRDSITN